MPLICICAFFCLVLASTEYCFLSFRWQLVTYQCGCIDVPKNGISRPGPVETLVQVDCKLRSSPVPVCSRFVVFEANQIRPRRKEIAVSLFSLLQKQRVLISVSMFGMEQWAPKLKTIDAYFIIYVHAFKSCSLKCTKLESGKHNPLLRRIVSEQSYCTRQPLTKCALSIPGPISAAGVSILSASPVWTTN